MPEVLLPEEVTDRVGETVSYIIASEEYEVFCPAGQDEMESYQHVLRGRCMSCGSKLEGDTTIVVASPGIIGIFCDGQCMTAMQTIGLLREIEDGIVHNLDAKGKE